MRSRETFMGRMPLERPHARCGGGGNSNDCNDQTFTHHRDSAGRNLVLGATLRFCFLRGNSVSSKIE